MTSATEKVNARHPLRSGIFTMVLTLAGALGLGAGCARQHLSDDYGRSYAAWFTTQHIQTPTAASEPARRALSSLDAQEASAISKNYRKTVGGQEASAGQGQMVMIGQTGAGRMEGYTPPPSVPAGQ